MRSQPGAAGIRTTARLAGGCDHMQASEGFPMTDDYRPEHHLGPKFADYLPARERARAERAATRNRLAREEEFLRTTTVAGHDFKREQAERERCK